MKMNKTKDANGATIYASKGENIICINGENVLYERWYLFKHHYNYGKVFNEAFSPMKKNSKASEENVDTWLILNGLEVVNE